MLFPRHDLLISPPDRSPLDHEAAALSLRAVTPHRGPGGRPVVSVAVDDELLWVTPAPTLPVGASRPPTPGMLVQLGLQLASDLALSTGVTLDAVFPDDDLVDAAAEAVAEYLADLPGLPFIDEPFGGEEGTD